MERLTYKEGNHYYSENDCLVEISTIDEDSLNVLQNMLDKLGAYEDAEEQGLLLPCKFGTQIYHFIYDFEEEKYMITKTRIIEVFENINGWYFRTLKDIPAFRLSDFGVCVFLTEEEAKIKLAEMEGVE